LTNYVHNARYPGDYDDISEDEYKKALEITIKCIEWVESMVAEEIK